MNTITIIPNQISNINWQTWFALLSLVISGYGFWYSHLRKAKIYGIISGLDIIKYKDFGEDDFKFLGMIVPHFLIQNIGVKTAIVENLRLKFKFKNKHFFAYPDFPFNESFSPEIEQPKIQREFIGLILKNDKEWKNDLPFIIHYSDINNIKKSLKTLSNLILTVFVEVKFMNKKNWTTIKTNNAKLNLSFCDLEPEFIDNPDINCGSGTKKMLKGFKSCYENKFEL